MDHASMEWQEATDEMWESLDAQARRVGINPNLEIVHRIAAGKKVSKRFPDTKAGAMERKSTAMSLARLAGTYKGPGGPFKLDARHDKDRKGFIISAFARRVDKDANNGHHSTSPLADDALPADLSTADPDGVRKSLQDYVLERLVEVDTLEMGDPIIRLAMHNDMAGAYRALLHRLLKREEP